MWYGLEYHLTNFRSFRRRWDDCGIGQNCSCSQCVWCWVVSAQPLLITAASVCVLFERPCVRIFFMPSYGCGFLWNTTLLMFTNNQAERRSSTAHLLVRWKHEKTTARWLCTRRRSICYHYSWHPSQKMLDAINFIVSNDELAHRTSSTSTGCLSHKMYPFWTRKCVGQASH